MTLEIDNLGKRYGETWALRNVSFQFSDGVVGLLGPNGAGKSTLMRIVTTFTTPTEGTVRWRGTDVTESRQAVREDIGYLPQEFGVYPHLTAEEFLSYLAGIRGVSSAGERIEDLLALVNLDHARDRRIGEYSGGMRQRIGIAQALLTDPALLVVDEPTVGLDPEERVRFRNVLTELGEDRVVVLSTHIVPDIEATAADVAVLNEGRAVAQQPPSELIGWADGAVWEWVVPDAELTAIRNEYTISGTTRRREGVRVRVVSESRPADAAMAVEPTLEDAYLHLLGGRADG
ncbi:MAG: ABC transporter ATP-binding protein [Halolamina sp.]|uniref:ABC transporter ATP-binding protein n=1 Tax=Halolamina sp. TaxID=1940283 RepID=UPI002FC2F957